MGDILVRNLTAENLEDPRAESDPVALEVDRERRIITTPGFKSFRRVSEVALGIDAMVREIIRWVGQS
jgi:enhancing lycopene biosynthesis protein 2